ncbi:50S ribosomal protein L22 [Patescibacteria group bacterium]|nr:50S ribosomal protein L22 [Patescibacteria group bacterium]
MQVKAQSKYLKISAKKMRLVANAIKGMDVPQALNYLKFIPRKASPLIFKTLRSALANAEHNFDLSGDNLFVKEIFADEGATLKRWRPRAFGRATPIQKKSAHLTIILEEKKSSSSVSKSSDQSLKKKKAKSDQKEDLKIVSAEEAKEREAGPKSKEDLEGDSGGAKRKAPEQDPKKIRNSIKDANVKKFFRRKST